jgi:hypothetical protein
MLDSRAMCLSRPKGNAACRPGFLPHCGVMVRPNSEKARDAGSCAPGKVVDNPRDNRQGPMSIGTCRRCPDHGRRATKWKGRLPRGAALPFPTPNAYGLRRRAGATSDADISTLHGAPSPAPRRAASLLEYLLGAVAASGVGSQIAFSDTFRHRCHAVMQRCDLQHGLASLGGNHRGGDGARFLCSVTPVLRIVEEGHEGRLCALRWPV